MSFVFSHNITREGSLHKDDMLDNNKGKVQRRGGTFGVLGLSKPKFSHSAAASGWAGWALAHPEFGSSVNPITTRGADYAHHITASPPGFEIPAASL